MAGRGWDFQKAFLAPPFLRMLPDPLPCFPSPNLRQEVQAWRLGNKAEGSKVRGSWASPRGQSPRLSPSPPQLWAENRRWTSREGGPEEKAACLSQAPCNLPSDVACDEGLGLSNNWAPVPLSPLLEPVSQSPLGPQQYILFTKRIAWLPEALWRGRQDKSSLEGTSCEGLEGSWWDVQGFGGGHGEFEEPGAGATTGLGFSG